MATLTLPPDALRVLVFEDSAMDAALVSRFLRAGGVEPQNIHVADSMGDAMDLLAADKVDVCLSDYLVQPHTGFDLMDECKRRHIVVPFIVMTSLDDPGIDDGALARGAYDFFAKSDLTVDGLARSIRYAMKRHWRERSLVRAAYHDRLSDLPNREAFLDRLARVLDPDRTPETGHAALVVFNLNNMRYLNDVYGVKVGDAVVRETGRRLKAARLTDQMTARLGSDDFAVLIPRVDGETDARACAARIGQVFNQPIRTYDGEHDVSAGMGVVVVPIGARENAVPTGTRENKLPMSARGPKTHARLTVDDVMQRAAAAVTLAKHKTRMSRGTEIVVGGLH